MPNTREKLIELLYEADRECCNKQCETCKHQGKRFFCKIHFYIDHLIANGVTILDKSETPKIVKRDFSFDSNLGWYMTMQLQWLGQSWFLCQQIPNEPSEYIKALLKASAKEDESKENDDG